MMKAINLAYGCSRPTRRAIALGCSIATSALPVARAGEPPARWRWWRGGVTPGGGAAGHRAGRPGHIGAAERTGSFPITLGSPGRAHCGAGVVVHVERALLRA
jgi:hypothetical protein